MKKYLILIFFMLNLILITVCACQIQEVEQQQSDKYYKLEYLATDGGSIFGNAEQFIECGDNGSAVTAIPNVGYEFVGWSDNDGANPTRIDANVNSDITATAIFKKLTYTVRYETDGNGTIYGETNQTVEYEESTTSVTAIPDDGYKFVKWSDGITTPERQDKNVVNDITVTSIFEKLTFSLSYEVGNGGYLIGNADQSVVYGESGTKVTAIPNDGYKFVKWSDGKTNDTRYEDEVKSDLAVTAEFEFLFAGGEGTWLNPFTIETYSQLINIRSFPDKNYRLLCDLDLSGINHEPIFDANESFSGEFDGGNKTIKNLTVKTNSNFPSLFGMVFDGIIADLNLENVSITTVDFNTMEDEVKYYVGTVAGYVAGYLDNVNVSGSITVNALSYDGVAIGGLAGMALGTVSDCNVDVQINVKNVFSTYTNNMNYPFVFGGMLGVADSAYIRDCNVAGQINVTECFWFEEGSVAPMNKYTDILIGGMVGYYFADRQVNAYIKDCETNISIYGDNHYNAGGFIGYLEIGSNTTLQVLSCSVYGDITCGKVGGFVYNTTISDDSSLIIEKCIAENNITAFAYGAGFSYGCSGSNGDLQILNCYTAGKIKTCNVFDTEYIVGYAAGFGWRLIHTTVKNCYAKRDINTAHGLGFSFMASYCVINSCFYEGTINLISDVGGLWGVGVAYSFADSVMQNCYVNVNFVTGEKTPSLFALIRDRRNSKLNNFYCVGNYNGKILSSYKIDDITNGHVFRANIEDDNLPHEDDVVDITIYDNIEDMYFLADKLNEGQDEVIWVNVENGLPKLKFEIE